MIAAVRNYILVTGAYWGFTLTPTSLNPVMRSSSSAFGVVTQ